MMKKFTTRMVRRVIDILSAGTIAAVVGVALVFMYPWAVAVLSVFAAAKAIDLIVRPEDTDT
jgi:predicted phage tail protein